ncbi:hypothetical protein C8Q77DRAFT_653505 [Trametes polyzona]|nr:hypothetical protein C8Q77DRAFT_653505 [Trametes polyzona]
MVTIARPTPFLHHPPTVKSGLADEWLGRDHDVEVPVYLSVHRPSASAGPQWSIAWPVGGMTEQTMTAWCHLQADAVLDLVDLGETTRYEYRGPITKTLAPHSASQYELGKTTLAMREEILRLAQEIGASSFGRNNDDLAPVANSQREWAVRLLDAMVTVGLVPTSERDAAIQQATAGIGSVSSA